MAHRDRAARMPIATRIRPDASRHRSRASATASGTSTLGLCASGNGLRACACRPPPGDRARIATGYGPRASRFRLPTGERGQVHFVGAHRARGRFTSLRWTPGRAKRCQAPWRPQPDPVPASGQFPMRARSARTRRHARGYGITGSGSLPHLPHHGSAAFVAQASRAFRPGPFRHSAHSGTRQGKGKLDGNGDCGRRAGNRLSKAI